MGAALLPAVPSLAQIDRGVQWVMDARQEAGSVYIHCESVGTSAAGGVASWMSILSQRAAVQAGFEFLPVGSFASWF